jgi:hypothetical protein
LKLLHIRLGLAHKAVYAVALGVEVIVGEFILHEEEDEHAGGNANRQPKYINQGVDRAAAEVPPGDGQIVGNHAKMPSPFMCSILRYSWRRISAGFTEAAFRVWKLTAARAIVPVIAPIMKNGQTSMATR